MSGTPQETYLERVAPRFVPIVRALIEAVEAAGEPLVAWDAYGMLLYGREAHRRDWIVAIGTSSKLVNLRFLHGDRLDDPGRLLRPGSSTLMTLDYASLEQVDAALVSAYVREAVAKDRRD